MKKVLTSLVLVCLAVAIAMPLSADDAKKKKKKKGGNDRSFVASIVKRITDKGVELTDEQSAKIKKLQDETAPKLAEANKVIGSKRREIAAARKKAAADGKKGKELKEAVEAAVTLTDAEKAALAKSQELQSGFQKELRGILTPEQLEKAGLKRGGKKKKTKKKKDAA